MDCDDSTMIRFDNLLLLADAADAVDAKDRLKNDKLKNECKNRIYFVKLTKIDKKLYLKRKSLNSMPLSKKI